MVESHHIEWCWICIFFNQLLKTSLSSMENTSIYVIGFCLYLIILLVFIFLYRKFKIRLLAFVLYSSFALLLVNGVYVIALKIFVNSYGSLLYLYSLSILNLMAVPTLIILMIIKSVHKSKNWKSRNKKPNFAIQK